MDALHTLVIQAQAGNLDAYGRIVRRLQDMAVGYAYAVLGDFHLAEDAAQEAFIRAYLDLGQLRDPTAFPGWLRRVVFTRCTRLTRGSAPRTVPLDAQVVSRAPSPYERVEARELRDAVLRAIRALPEPERAVTALFYINGYSQNEIGDFLDIPSKTVKSRLHTARRKLRERMMDMVKDHLHEGRPSRDEAFAKAVIDDLVGLTDREIQIILREVDSRDLTIALKGLREELKGRIFANMSERVKLLIEDEMVYAGSVPAEEIEKRHARIMEIVERLIGAGQITPPDQRPPRHESKKPWPTPEYLAQKEVVSRLLQDTPFHQLGFDGVTEIVVALAEMARIAGILKLEDFRDLTDEEVLRSAIRLAVDGFEPELIQAILSTRIRSLIHDHETRCRMILEGIHSIQCGDSPRTTEYKLRTFYMPVVSERADYTEASVSSLKAKLQTEPGEERSLEAITDIFTEAAILVRTEDVNVLNEIAGLEGDPLLALAVKLAVDGMAPNVVQRVLHTQMRARLHQRETRYNLVAEGIRLIQHGYRPAVIGEFLRWFYETEASGSGASS